MKKRMLSLMLAVCIAISLFSGLTFSAGAETEGYYTYEIDEGKAIITNVDENISGDVTIPSTLGGYPVTKIEAYAFDSCIGLTSITIPNSVIEIDNWAFYYCSGIASITIPDSVTEIGCTAFSDCAGLESISVSSGNTKYHSSGNCLIETATKTLVSGCKNSVIPSDGSVTNIGDYAFC